MNNWIFSQFHEWLSGVSDKNENSRIWEFFYPSFLLKALYFRNLKLVALVPHPAVGISSSLTGICRDFWCSISRTITRRVSGVHTSFIHRWKAVFTSFPTVYSALKSERYSLRCEQFCKRCEAISLHSSKIRFYSRPTKSQLEFYRIYSRLRYWDLLKSIPLFSRLVINRPEWP